MASVSAVPAAGSSTFAGLPKIKCYPLLSSVVFFACDMVALGLTVTLVLLGEWARGQTLDLRLYSAMWPAVAVFIATFFSCNLYPGVIYNAVTELRRLGGAV